MPARSLMQMMAKQALSPTLEQLLIAKEESDRKNYANKHKILQQLMQQNPDDFIIDSEEDYVYGITHTPTGFRLHIPKDKMPSMGKAADTTPIQPITPTVLETPPQAIAPIVPETPAVSNPYAQPKPTPYMQWRDDPQRSLDSTQPNYVSPLGAGMSQYIREGSQAATNPAGDVDFSKLPRISRRDILSEGFRGVGRNWGTPADMQRNIDRQAEEFNALSPRNQNLVAGMWGKPWEQGPIAFYSDGEPGRVPRLTQQSDVDSQIYSPEDQGAHSGGVFWGRRYNDPNDPDRATTPEHVTLDSGRNDASLIGHEYSHGKQYQNWINPDIRVPGTLHSEIPAEHGADAVVIMDDIRRNALASGVIQNEDDLIPEDYYNDTVKGLEYSTTPQGNRNRYDSQFIRMYNNADPELQKYMRGKVVRNDQQPGGPKMAGIKVGDNLRSIQSTQKGQIKITPSQGPRNPGLSTTGITAGTPGQKGHVSITPSFGHSLLQDQQTDVADRMATNTYPEEFYPGITPQGKYQDMINSYLSATVGENITAGDKVENEKLKGYITSTIPNQAIAPGVINQFSTASGYDRPQATVPEIFQSRYSSTYGSNADPITTSQFSNRSRGGERIPGMPLSGANPLPSNIGKRYAPKATVTISPTGTSARYHNTKLNAALQDFGVDQLDQQNKLDTIAAQIKELNNETPKTNIENYRDKVKTELSSSSTDLKDTPITLESSK